MQKSGNGNGKNGNGRRAAIDAAVEVFTRVIQEHDAVDHFSRSGGF